MYCSIRCQGLSRNVLDQQARLEERRGRVCDHCGDPMPVSLNAAARYCSQACQADAGRQRYSKRLARDCAQCGARFAPKVKGQIYCCRACYGAAQRIVQPRACEACGVVFQPRDDRARFCSHVCDANHKWKVGTFRCALSPRILDRILASRPKRRYAQRLTPARLDRLLARVSRAG